MWVVHRLVLALEIARMVLLVICQVRLLFIRFLAVVVLVVLMLCYAHRVECATTIVRVVR